MARDRLVAGTVGVGPGVCLGIVFGSLLGGRRVRGSREHSGDHHGTRAGGTSSAESMGPRGVRGSMLCGGHHGRIGPGLGLPVRELAR
jgi:hypothetical protein